MKAIYGKTDGTILDVQPDSVNFPNSRNDRGIYQSDNLTESDIGKNLTEISGAIEAVRDEYLSELSSAINEYITSHYSLGSQQTMTDLMITGNSAQQALVAQVWDWRQAALTEYYSRKESLQTALTVPEIFAVSDDFVSFDTSKPDIDLSAILTATGE